MGFAAAQIDSLEFASLADYVQGRRYAVEKALLDDGGWSLARSEVQTLLHQLKNTGTKLIDFVNTWSMNSMA